jgi:hypothetical protein
LLEAVQLHDRDVRTSTFTSLSSLESEISLGFTEYVQAGAAWVTVNVRPAIVAVPERAAPLFSATVTSTVPLPLSGPDDRIVSQSAWLDAVQAQPFGAVTVTVSVAPLASTLRESGLMLNVQAPDCDTVNVCPAIVSDPVREAPAGWAAALKVTVPFPVPPAPPVTVSHPAWLVAVHAHVPPVVTPTEPVPPAAGTSADRADNV